MPETDNSPDRPPFPPWLRELCYFGGIIVALTIFLLTMRSDLRSSSERLDRVAEDVKGFSSRLSSIESRLPNKEAEEQRLKVLEEKVDTNRDELDFAIAKLVKWQEDVTRELIRKGVM